jgi:hypothetical protein
MVALGAESGGDGRRRKIEGRLERERGRRRGKMGREMKINCFTSAFKFFSFFKKKKKKKEKTWHVPHRQRWGRRMKRECIEAFLYPLSLNQINSPTLFKKTNLSCLRLKHI